MTSATPKPRAGEHTPGKWMRDTQTGVIVIEAESGRDIAVCNGKPPRSTDNARRIVACLNACEGMPTDMLEAGNYAHDLDVSAGAIAERDLLRERERELVEALDWAVKRINRSELGHGWSAASVKYDEVYSLLAKHGR